MDRMGQLIIKMGYFDKAEEIYQRLLGQAIDIQYAAIAHLNPQLGFLKKEQGDLSNALSFYQKTLDTMRQYLPHEDHNLATAYHKIGLVHQALGEHSIALEFFEKTLEIEEQCLASDDPALARTYCNIGLLYNEMKNYSTALAFYAKARYIQEKSLPCCHPYLFTT
jgi:tetratricopeptide (TPR) repeat protein